MTHPVVMSLAGALAGLLAFELLHGLAERLGLSASTEPRPVRLLHHLVLAGGLVTGFEVGTATASAATGLVTTLALVAGLAALVVPALARAWARRRGTPG